MPPKSGHSRAKNIDYDDDELYSDEDYYEEEEAAADAVTDEDEARLKTGTTEVRSILDPSLDVTDAQIRESLWHYYYDIGKTVTYLKSKICIAFGDDGCTDHVDKHALKPETHTAKPKAPSRFDEAAGVAGQNAPTGKQDPEESTTCIAFGLGWPVSFDEQSPERMSDTLYTGGLPTAKDFFWDTPWGNVPSHRLGRITEMPPPEGYKGGLLGGSSKLQALAAKRKQKQDAAKASEGTETDKAVALLDKLNVKDATPTETKQPPLNKYPSRKRSPPPEEIPTPDEDLDKASSPKAPAVQFPDLRAPPSMFGATLCGLAEAATTNQNDDVPPSFPLPYATLDGFKKADPFAGPSPDDIVRQAQARGAKRG
jgi:elongation factor 1 alpha-like protein